MRYLDAFIAKAGIGSAYLVVQDWGTRARLSSCERAARNSCAGSRSWSSSGRSRPGRNSCEARRAREIFRKFRTPGEGETTDPRGQCLRRARAAGRDAAQAQRPGDGGLSRAFPHAAVATADLALPQRNPDRRRARRRLRDDGDGARRARRFRPIRSSCSRPIPARSSRRRSPRISPTSSRTAGSSSSATAFISCRRIIPRRSDGRSPPSSPRSKGATAGARLKAGGSDSGPLRPSPAGEGWGAGSRRSRRIDQSLFCCHNNA